MRKLFLLLMGVVLIGTLSFGQQFTDLSQEVPFDSSIRKGVLPNGLTYYIKHNENPKGAASFYIYQNVGASLETDEQDGLAHFLEHMAFNGTTTFPGKSMLDMLEKNGVKFGRDVNAYTTRNETVYNMSRVPTANEGLVDSCLLILRDWCDELSLDEAEIDAERGVISEEWRTRRNASFRVQAKTAPIIFNNTIYAERDAIGELDVIKNFDPKELRSFYHNWYRTDLQAVAIVGDIDVDTIEAKVKELFSAIPAIENPMARTVVAIPDNNEPMYVQVMDPDYKNVSVDLKIRYKKRNNNSFADLRENYLNSFFNSLLSSRIKELVQESTQPFKRGSVGLGSLERGYGTFDVFASCEPGKEQAAFEAVYTELERVLRFGFTDTELERLKTNMLVSVENSYQKRDLIGAEAYCKAIKTAYLEQVSIPDAEFKYQFAKEIIPGITAEEVSAVAKKYLTDVNRSYVITGPEREPGTVFISPKEIEAIIARVQSSDLAPYIDNAPVSTELLSSLPEAGEIVSEKKIEEFDATEWTLSNGAKVVYKFDDYVKEAVVLSGQSSGGRSLYGVEDIPSFNAAADFVSGFGIGEFDPIQFKKVTTGKTASCGFDIGSYSESISGSTKVADLETMLQLVYMRFEEPRFDKDNFDRLMEINYRNAENEVKTAKSIMRDTLSSILSNGNPRSLKFSKEYLDQINFDRMKEIYQERFDNAGDFTFFIVGDVSEEELKPLVEQYLGSIRSTGKTEKWVDTGDYYPTGKHEYRIELPMPDPKATVVLKFRNDYDYSREAVVYQSILGSILNLRYTENIREKEGGTYGVSVKPSFTRIPDVKYGLSIQFDCDPTKADYLKELVYKELKVVQKNVQQADLDKVVLNMKKNLEQQVENNGYWMSVLQTYYATSENKLDPAYYETIIENVTTKDIAKAAKKFLKNADVLDVVFLSEDKI
ncbi:M16 family metallopeptidase [Mangrovibacterium diazotrophicum]|uniref:Zinc protease n=1 Tax=Mangrovibacterium diazotrophicum TaxID=1261403 RepID=A0A419W651_9BACT|nr:M16 family metallopeptidase [Mangrovibacterium diazotrophicum]RKD90925.1 zinc protease [Mangrovibacterium diazotrophicum]